MTFIKKFKRRISSSVQRNSKANGDSSKTDAPVDTKSTLPTWIKWIVGGNLIMVHVVVLMTGFNTVPFMLSDTVLVVYIVAGMGTPVGLASKTVQNALASLFGLKQN